MSGKVEAAARKDEVERRGDVSGGGGGRTYQRALVIAQPRVDAALLRAHPGPRDPGLVPQLPQGRGPPGPGGAGAWRRRGARVHLPVPRQGEGQFRGQLRLRLGDHRRGPAVVDVRQVVRVLPPRRVKEALHVAVGDALRKQRLKNREAEKEMRSMLHRIVIVLGRSGFATRRASSPRRPALTALSPSRSRARRAAPAFPRAPASGRPARTARAHRASLKPTTACT